MAKKLSHEDYTVGWICPLEVEQIAAMEMLDEEHERLPQTPMDHNVYNLGSIAGHNVVIAGLHQPGNSPAATVVTQMRMTFPNLRFGMLVGIGGGVPMKTDNGMIRLGDVVVSKPAGGHSGAVQYDHGKAKVGRFERTGALAPPPAVLLNAAQDLAAKRARSRKDPIEDNIKRIDTSIRGLRKYKHPGMAKDHLYKAEYVHREPGASCDECGCDPSQRIQRLTDGEDDEPYIVVHRGTIASGELVVKDALLRDQLAKEYDLLCYEMEAAGALADFPCIIIRGISDYCDSHKNDQWHGYAAAAAAAYARQLFSHMPVDEVKRYISETAEENIYYMKHRQEDRDRQDILDWLTPIDYGPQQSDYIRRRQPGTGQWLLGSDEYQTWLKTSRQTLFCPGIPGAGKTILTSIVIDELTTRFGNDETVGIAYVYCSFRRKHEQRAEDLLASLLKQLSQGLPTLPESVESLYKKHKEKRTRPSLDEISKALQSVIAVYSKAFIIVDALDECQTSEGCRPRFLTEMFNLNEKCGSNFFATSRFIPDISNRFYGSTSLEIRASPEDVRRYVDGHISQLPSFVGHSPDLKEEVATEIVRAVDGMFLLAQLHLGSLIGKKSPKAFRTALAKLPSGSEAYNHAYQNAMERIEGQIADQEELAKQVLSWITYAQRPLTTTELQHALAVEVGEPELDKENLPQLEDIVSVCAGLVTVDDKSGIIRLVHYTTQEYFESTQKQWFPNAESEITTICITYLSFDIFESGFCQTDADLEERLHLNPFYNYAAHNWGHHAREASTSCQEVIDFLECEAKMEASSQALMAVGGRPFHWDCIQEVPKQMTGLHLAAYFGIREAVNALLEKADMDPKDSHGRTPLSYAAMNGHEATVQLLLNAGGIAVNSKDCNGRTPLLYAGNNGHEATVQLLLNAGGGAMLGDYWEIHSRPDFNGNLVLWFAEQCQGISSELNEMINYCPEAINDYYWSRISRVEEKLDKRFGPTDRVERYHIFIDPQHVWSFSPHLSRRGDSTFLSLSTYMSPECNLKLCQFPACNIWALACLYLDFVTWLLYGFEGYERFSISRSEPESDRPSFILDTFFRKVKSSKTGRWGAIIKPQVHTWILTLRKNENCTEFILDFLDLIEHHMLVFEYRRMTIQHIHSRVLQMYERCKKNRAYGISRKRGELC